MRDRHTRATILMIAGMSGAVACAKGSHDGGPADAVRAIDAHQSLIADAHPQDVIDASEIDAADPPDAAVIDAAPDARPPPDAKTTIDAKVTVDAKPMPDGKTTPDGGTVGGVVFACSQTTLFKIDPATGASTQVGGFGWPASVGNDAMADIAVAPDGSVTGASSGHLYACSATTAACTLIGNLAHAVNALGYAPKGTVDPSNEALVGAANDGSLYRIDTATAAMTSIGHFSGGHASSGDVAYAGGHLLASVNPGGTNDSIATIALPGGATTVVGTTSLPWVWGLASAGGTLYGFTLSREIVTIDPATGVATHLATGTADWYGAGGR
jgi:hypothetical protein